MKAYRMACITKYIILLLLSTFFIPPIIHSEPLPVIRISVENTNAHVQTKSVLRFTNILKEKLEGLYTIEFYPAASLFKDADIFRALAQGKVEIAVPGTWQFDKLVPEVGVFLLPSLYGRPGKISYALMESEVGKNVISSIEKKIDVKVLGRFIDLGHTHIFSTRKVIENPNDFITKRIRVAGGIANELRIEALGASAVTIAWPDLPLALKGGKVDGVLTSYETIVSAKLYENYINHVWEDNEYFAQYVPIVSRPFWNRLPPTTQNIILSAWESIVDEARVEAAIAQYEAKLVMLRNGSTIIIPKENIITQIRNRLVKEEKNIAEKIGIPITTYTLFTDFIKNLDTPNYEYST